MKNKINIQIRRNATEQKTRREKRSIKVFKNQDRMNNSGRIVVSLD